MVDCAGAPLSAQGMAAAVAALGAVRAAVWALLAVETGGVGFLPDRRPKILFERHVFHRLTGGRFDAVAPDVSHAVPGGYGALGAHQWDRLAVARRLDAAAAVQAASWGLGQIMGEKHALAGFASAEAMIAAFTAGEDAQIAGMAAFVQAIGAAGFVAAGRWADYARRYNGVGYAANHYDTRLATACAQFTQAGCPDLDVRAAQLLLGYLGVPLVVDGMAGPATGAALRRFQAGAGIDVSGRADAATLAALRVKTMG